MFKFLVTVILSTIVSVSGDNGVTVEPPKPNLIPVGPTGTAVTAKGAVADPNGQDVIGYMIMPYPGPYPGIDSRSMSMQNYQNSLFTTLQSM